MTQWFCGKVKRQANPQVLSQVVWHVEQQQEAPVASQMEAENQHLTLSSDLHVYLGGMYCGTHMNTHTSMKTFKRELGFLEILFKNLVSFKKILILPLSFLPCFLPLLK